MCSVCGCSPTEADPDHHGTHTHTLADGSVVRHADHEHEHEHHHEPHHVHVGRGVAGTEVAGMSQGRLVQLEAAILGKNDAFAAENRAELEARGVHAFNLISSPGSGKTTLLVETLKRLEGHPAAVIEGDQQTQLDADRIRATGVTAVQVNTGKGCHLDAQMVKKALAALHPARDSALFIENVGNLVCPAGFDLGESDRVVLLSITEGEDKPLKYPDAFAGADLVVVTKLDLQPLVKADLEQLRKNVRAVNPTVDILEVSARTGAGMERWMEWLAT